MERHPFCGTCGSKMLNAVEHHPTEYDRNTGKLLPPRVKSIWWRCPNYLPSKPNDFPNMGPHHDNEIIMPDLTWDKLIKKAFGRWR